MLTNFFRTIPNELVESALTDGASRLQILWRIMLPLSMPALVTLVVVNALWVWNELLIALVFLPDDKYKTLMVGVTVFQEQVQARRAGDDGRDAAGVRADARCSTLSASGSSSAASRPGRSRDRSRASFEGSG